MFVDNHSLHLVAGERFAWDWPYSGNTTGLVQARDDEVRLSTGLATCVRMPLTVEVHDADPGTPAGGWEDVAESSLTVHTDDFHVVEICDVPSVRLPLGAEGAATYRVRVHAHGRDLEYDGSAGDPAGERYLVQLWPAAHAPDRVVRLSAFARRALDAAIAHARNPLPPLPLPPRIPPGPPMTEPRPTSAPASGSGQHPTTIEAMRRSADDDRRIPPAR
ncbi:hypothetical protein [Embleya sp. NPDC050493]|uniref:hypothetical protein n=1 Tax=Embleya sp. NPDC050493 TaxID=3363989 RepID=UPI0037B8A29E